MRLTDFELLRDAKGNQLAIISVDERLAPTSLKTRLGKLAVAHGGNVVSEGQAGYMDEVFAYTDTGNCLRN